MSMSKLSQESYVQGFVNAVESMGLSSLQKEAAYKLALDVTDPTTAAALGGSALAGLGALRYKMVSDEENADIKRNRIGAALIGASTGAGAGGLVSGAITNKRLAEESAKEIAALKSRGFPVNDMFMRATDAQKAEWNTAMEAAKKRAMKGFKGRAGLGLLLGGTLGAGTLFAANEGLRDVFFDKDERVMRKFLGRTDNAFSMSNQ